MWKRETDAVESYPWTYQGRMLLPVAKPSIAWQAQEEVSQRPVGSSFEAVS